MAPVCQDLVGRRDLFTVHTDDLDAAIPRARSLWAPPIDAKLLPRLSELWRRVPVAQVAEAQALFEFLEDLHDVWV